MIHGTGLCTVHVLIQFVFIKTLTSKRNYGYHIGYHTVTKGGCPRSLQNSPYDRASKRQCWAVVAVSPEMRLVSNGAGFRETDHGSGLHLPTVQNFWFYTFGSSTKNDRETIIIILTAKL